MLKREQVSDDAFEDVDFDPFMSPGQALHKSHETFAKNHDEHMRALTQAMMNLHESHKALCDSVTRLHEHLAAPRKIIRDQQGRAVGMESMPNKEGMH